MTRGAVSGELTNDGETRDPEFIPPRKPYSFLAMLDGILQFSAQTLVDNGRLSFWMPTANDENQEIPVPTHPYLEMLSVCTQNFHKCTSLPMGQSTVFSHVRHV